MQDANVSRLEALHGHTLQECRQAILFNGITDAQDERLGGWARQAACAEAACNHRRVQGKEWQWAASQSTVRCRERL